MRSAWSEFTVKRKFFVFFLCLLVTAWTAFIFSNSLKNAEASDMQSGGIVDFVIKTFFRVFDEQRRSGYVGIVTLVVRKLAHFIEFFILSSLLFLFFYVLQRNKKTCFLLSVSATAFVAFIDECLQLLSDGRACRFTDVVIDSAGGVFGAVFVCAVLFVINRLRND